MRMTRILRVAGLLALAWAAALGATAQAFQVRGLALTLEECATLAGGETYVDVDVDGGTACVSSVPRDRQGLDYSRASSYTIEVHNRITDILQDGKNDKYKPRTFPKTETNLEVRKIPDKARQERYGSSGGEWIATNATARVTAFPLGKDGKADESKPFEREDSGYFWHPNNAKPFSQSVSAGCLISRKEDIDRIIATLKADSGGKKLKVR